MLLDDARRLKRRIRAAIAPLPFGLGIGLTADPRDVRLAVLLADEEDRRFLDCPEVRTAIGGFRRDVDIEVIGDVRPCGAARMEALRDSTLRIGASVGHHTGGVGSLGFFAARKSDGRRGFVSCNHVIAMADEGADGDAVVSPSTLDGAARTVGALDGTYPRLGASPPPPADCAFATLVDGARYDAATLEGGTLALEAPRITRELVVTKAGRGTDARPGIVSKVEVDNVWVRYGPIRIGFEHVIQIGSASGRRFCDPGDSGALVYTAATFQPVGLLFATSLVGGPHNAGWTWAHPIRHVTDALRVELVNA